MPDQTEFFSVTTPVTSLTGRDADVPVTITNLTGRPVRVRLRIIPTEPAKAEWVQSAEGWEFDYGLGATRTHKLQTHVPQEASAGVYMFLPEARAEDDEDQYGRGSTFALTVPTPAKPPGGIPRWVFPVVAAIVVLILGVVAAVHFLRPDKAEIAVPEVTGKTGSTAITLISAAGLTPKPATVSTDPCDPKVLTQDPAKDKKVGKKTPVTLTFDQCNNLVTVPNMVGHHATEAVNVLKGLGLEVQKFVVGTGNVCDPLIAAQTPDKGTVVKKGSTVILGLPPEPFKCNVLVPVPIFKFEKPGFDIFPQS